MSEIKNTKKRIRTNGLHATMICMTMVPMIILGIILVVVTANRYTSTVQHEVATQLEDVCKMTENLYDLLYDGDFALIGEEKKVFVKGATALNGKYEIVDDIKEKTGIDVTIFYYDTRMLTTLVDETGNRIVGTGCGNLIFQQVFQNKKSKFYADVDIFGSQYFSYYEPLSNSSGRTIGMIFAGKPASDVNQRITSALCPIILLEIIGTLLVSWICIQWTGTLLEQMMAMKTLLEDMTEGKLNGDLDPSITSRNDEVGEMGNAMIKMQNAIKNLVERDALTGLRNRRYGNIRLQEIQNKNKLKGTDFSVAIADIDFFKKINDTYGHECGDLVLKTVSDTLARGLRGQGFAARWGGEEFLMAFQYVGAQKGEEMLNGIRKEIENLRIPYGDQIVKLSMSFGIVDGCYDCSVDKLVKEADDRLYYAKSNGRNRVVRIIPKDENNEVE